VDARHKAGHDELLDGCRITLVALLYDAQRLVFSFIAPVRKPLPSGL
jgi:hypothetical protein